MEVRGGADGAVVAPKSVAVTGALQRVLAGAVLRKVAVAPVLNAPVMTLNLFKTKIYIHLLLIHHRYLFLLVYIFYIITIA